MFTHQRGRFYFVKKLTAGITLICFTAQPIFVSAQVVADPNAGQKKPTIDSTANGLPLVQITAPSAAGVSHNQYQQFNVDPQGLILNNARTYTQTQQAGFVDGNPNLVNGPARIILNEVTSTNPSLLRGYTEVAGQRAEVIIANPNGITCNGCGFINASRGVLTTGMPLMNDGNLDALQVTNGSINIEGLGLNAANLDQADLIARSVNLNAQVWAQYLNVITGPNQVNYADLSTQTLSGVGVPPSFSIDVAALGGMYANRIRLVGTENGVGVNSQGVINSTGDLTITSEGRIILAEDATAGGNLTLSAKDSVTNSKLLVAAGNASLSAQSIDSIGTVGAGLTSDGEFSDAGELTLNVNGLFNNQGLVRSGGNADINAGSVNNNTKTIAALGNLTINTVNALNNQSGTLYAGENFDLNAATINNANGSVVAGQDLAIGAQSLTGTGKLIAGRDLSLNLNDNFTNGVGGEVKANRDLTLTTLGAITNNSDLTADSIVTQSSSLQNTSSIIGRNINVKATADIVNSGNAALIAATESVSVFAGGNISNLDGANIYSLGSVAIAGDENLNNADNVLNSSATIQAEGNIGIYANQITNKKSIFTTENRVISTQGGSDLIAPPRYSTTFEYTRVTRETRVVNDSAPGQILAGANMTLNGSIENNVSTISAGGDINFDVATLNNISIGTRTITKEGQYVYRDHNAERCIDRFMGSCVNWEVYVAVTGTSRRNETVSVEQIGNYPAVFTANGNISGSAITINNVGAVQGSIGNAVSAVNNATANNLILPQNGLYILQTEPGQRYLIETNPRFADFKNFISSDYMLQRLSYEPQGAMKRLGDGFYETQLILNEITQLTGRRFLDGYTSAEEQFRSLMDNAVATAEKFQLKVGIALDEKQVAQLTSDMVWLVEKEVSGQKVLVPVVYLAQLKDRDLTPTGSVIAANNIQLFTSNDLTNTGVIKSNKRTEIVSGNVVNRGGAIGSGEITQIDAQNDILNQGGSISGGDISLKAGRDIKNETLTQTSGMGVTINTAVGKQAEVSARGNLDINTGRDFVALGAEISSQDNASIKAGRNLEIGTVENKNRVGVLYGGVYINESLVNVISNIQSGGTLNLVAQNDVKLEGAQVAAGENLNLIAGGNVAVTAVKDSAMTDSVFSSGKRSTTHIHTEDETVIGSNLQAQGNVTIAALPSQLNQQNTNAGNVLIEGSSVNAGAAAVIVAEKDVTIKEVSESHYRLSETVSTKKKNMGTAKVTKKSGSESEAEFAVGSTISGDTVQIASGKDLTIQGSNVVATGDISLSATDNVVIKSAQETSTSSSYSSVKKSGMLGGGGVATFGTQHTKKNADQVSINQVASNVGSLEGNVTINAGKDYKQIGSDVLAANDLSVEAKNISVEAAYNTSTYKETTQFKQGGMTVGIGAGSISTPLLDMQSSEKRRHEVEDDRLQALYAYKELRDLYDMGGAVKNLIGGDPATVASLKIDFGSSSSKTEVTSKSSIAMGSNMNAGGNVSLVATGDKNIANSGNLGIIGSNINGQNILLSAANDITMQSAENRIENDTKNKSKSGSVGVSIGYNGDSFGLAVTAQGSMAKGRSDGDSLTHTETQINAGQTLTVKSGRDTNLIGAQAKGDKIVADIGRNLNIVSQQDVETYKSQQVSVSGGASVTVIGAGGASGNFSANKSKTNSNYRSVQEQSGFFAGKEGFDINVKGNTDLKGAVIASDAEASKNKLSTETFTYSDIENKAEYKASSMGVSAGYSSQGGPSVMPNISPVSKDKSNSMTLASVAQGTIEIRADKNKPENQKTDLSKLNRDPTTANKVLDKIFDQKKIEEKQELAKVFGQEAFRVVGDIAKHYTKDYEKAELRKEAGERYLDLKEKQKQGALSDSEAKQLTNFESGQYPLNPESAGRMIDQAKQDIAANQDQYDAWKDGSANKILLHTFVGALQGELAGGSGFAGGIGAGAGEASRQLTDQLSNKALQQWASVIVGAAAAKMTGGDNSDMQTGAAASLDGERYNRQLHQSEIDKAKKYAKQFKEWLKGQGEDVTVEEAEGRLARQMLRWVDFQTAYQDGREDLAVTAFLGKNSVQVTQKDYYDFRVNQDIRQNNQDIYLLASAQKDAGYTFKELQDKKNTTGTIVSVGTSFSPIGPYQDILTAISGVDPISGEEVEGFWRYTGLIPLVGEIRAGVKGADAANDVVKLSNEARGATNTSEKIVSHLDEAAFQDLAKMRKDLSLPSAGSVADKATLAKLEVNGKEFYGINAHGQPVDLKVNAISKTHAEVDALQQAKNAGLKGGSVTIYVDRDLCLACGQNGGIASIAREMGLSEVKVVTPSGTTIVKP